MRTKFSSFLLAALSILVLLGCGGNKSDSQKDSAVQPDPVTQIDWGAMEEDAKPRKVEITPRNYLDFEYAKAIAFALPEAWQGQPFAVGVPLDGTLLADSVSRKLNKREVEQLNKLLSGYEHDGMVNPGADCWNPRHFIVFLDKKGNLVHHISVCFDCQTEEFSKPHLASFDNLEGFFNSIGLPVFLDIGDHRDYFDSVVRSR